MAKIYSNRPQLIVNVSRTLSLIKHLRKQWPIHSADFFLKYFCLECISYIEDEEGPFLLAARLILFF